MNRKAAASAAAAPPWPHERDGKGGRGQFQMSGNNRGGSGYPGAAPMAMATPVKVEEGTISQPAANAYIVGAPGAAPAGAGAPGVRMAPVYASPAPNTATIIGGRNGVPPDALPIYGTGALPTDVIMTEGEQRLMDTYGLGRGLRLLAILDSLLLLIDIFFGYFLMAAVFWGPICGFLGATQYRKIYVQGYVCYYLLRIALNAAFVIFGHWIYVLFFMINCWLLRYVFVFMRLLQSCSQAELETLRSPESSLRTSRPYFVIF